MPDTLYRAIREALSGPIDGAKFERCAVELLREYYPTLRPVEGGNDAGMDGIGELPDGTPFFLVATVQRDARANLKRNVKSQIERAIRMDTEVLYLESPTNPLLKLIDLRGAAEIAKAHGLISIIDNTFATPCGQQPINLGIDVVVHSMTKYLSGTGAVIAGAIVGEKEFVTRAKKGALRNFGAVISPFNAWLTLHGITTLPLRFARHCENAVQVAGFLETHPAVAWVRYPGLQSHPQHDLAQQQMEAFGGMITLELKGGRTAGENLVDRLERCALAVSLGDVRTLICHPASTTHSHVPAEIRQQIGITDGLVRISVGLEDIEDILADLEQALETCAS